MNFLGMGPMELMVILVLALIIFGPGKLPEIAGQVGRVVRDFRRTTAELSSEFNRTLSLEIEERKAADTVAPPVPPAEYQSYAAAPAEAAPVAAVEPSEAPQTIAPPVSSVIQTPAPEPVPAVAPAPASAPVASRRRTIDEDLAPPY
jgi:TatA/E family protein of Tat protein translocase